MLCDPHPCSATLPTLDRAAPPPAPPIRAHPRHTARFS